MTSVNRRAFVTGLGAALAPHAHSGTPFDWTVDMPINRRVHLRSLIDVMRTVSRC